VVGKIFKKVVIITGASSGLGKEISKNLSSEDFYLVICARRLDLLKKNFKNKKNIFYSKVDVTNEKQIKVFIKKTISKFGKVDVLINNAGLTLNSKLDSIKSNELDRLFKTNLYAPFYFIRECLPSMKKQNYGRIINISSGGSVNCAKNYSVYSASKAGLNTIAKSLNNELDGFNIKINTLSPGPIKTKMFPNNILSAKLCLPTLKYLIDLNKNGPSGKFFWFKKKINIIPNLKINWGKPDITGK
jgi:3-oxoacyl-[acyl-carrier protein] reductase